jgi:hypothetical protein
LGAIFACSYKVLLLHRKRGQTAFLEHGEFLRGRLQIHSTSAAVVAHPVVVRNVGHVGDVGVVDGGDIHVGDLAVVAELIAVPISAVIAPADIAVAVINASVVANETCPEAAVKTVAALVVVPVAGRPEGSGVRSVSPHSGHPVIPAATVVPPITRGPNVVRVGAGRLLIFR